MNEKNVRICMAQAFGGMPHCVSRSAYLVMFLCVGALASVGLSDTITAMECYVDYDPGVGNAIPIPPVDGSYDSAYETGEVSLDTTGLEPGPHLVYVRSRKSNGVWGTYPPVLLYVYQRTAVVAAEYYIDTDPGFGMGMPLEPVDGWFDYINELITATIPIEGLGVGKHTLYVRAKSSANVWGVPRAVSFEVVRPITLSAAECGFGKSTDLQPTFGTYPMQAVDFVFDSTTEDIIKRGVLGPSNEGDYRVFVRAKDDRDIWGPWFYEDVFVGLDALMNSVSGDIGTKTPRRE